MTVTITPRRASLVILAVISPLVVSLLGTTRSGGTPAQALTGAVNTASAQTPAITGVGGAGITVGGRADVAGPRTRCGSTFPWLRAPPRCPKHSRRRTALLT